MSEKTWGLAVACILMLLASISIAAAPKETAAEPAELTDGGQQIQPVELIEAKDAQAAPNAPARAAEPSEQAQSGTPLPPQQINTVFPDLFPERGTQPKGPAEVKVAEFLETSAYTGAATYFYPIEVPPGTNSLQPELSIFYSSQKAYDLPTVLGTGWQVSQSHIQRDDNHTPANASDDFFQLVLGSSTTDLVFSPADGRFHAKIESFMLVENISTTANQLGKYWRVKTKDGTAYRFGASNNSEQVSNLSNMVWRWNLDTITDTHNNSIFFAYNENPYPNDVGAAYLANVTYNNDRTRLINFTYEDSDRQDLWDVYLKGNRIKQARRLKEIRVLAGGQLARKYAFRYAPVDVNSRWLLSNVTAYGIDGVSAMPSTAFSYKQVATGWAPNNTWRMPVNADSGTRLADVNGDGLADILKAYYDGANTVRQAYINNGSGWALNNTWAPPEAFVWIQTPAVDYGVRVVELNGDGYPDLVRSNGMGAGQRSVWFGNGSGWVNASNDSWLPPTVFATIGYTPGVGYYSINTGADLIDLNGDGRADIVAGTEMGTYHSDGNYWTWACVPGSPQAWLNTGSGWQIAPQYAPPACLARNGQDLGVRFVDLNGDGLTDIAYGPETWYTNGDGIHYYCDPQATGVWLNNGNGWTPSPAWKLPTCITDHTGADMATRFADVNGDGLADMAIGKETSWVDSYGHYTYACVPANTGVALNTGSGWASGTGWALPYCLASHTGTDFGVRISDINGDSVPDFAQNYQGASATYLSNAAKAYLLSGVRNSLGGAISIDYKPSTAFDNKGNDSRFDLGFNAWAVYNVTKDNGLAVSRVISNWSYDYANGSYDQASKEFRGFANSRETRPDGSYAKHYFLQDEGRQGREYQTETFDNAGNIYQRRQANWTDSITGGIHLVLLANGSARDYDGIASNPKSASTAYAYDAYGNTVFTASFGDDALLGDERFEYFEYAYNSSAWIVGKPKRQTLYDSTNSTKMRETLYSYDGMAYGISPVRGDVTRKEDYLNTGPSNPVSIYQYDSYGNAVNATDANGHTMLTAYGARDPTFTFPDQAINARGHTTNYYFDLGTGNLLSATDANGYWANYSYDAFGRVAKEISPYDSTAYPTKAYQYEFDGNAPETVKAFQREHAGTNDTYNSSTLFDGFGRSVQSIFEGENARWVSTNRSYDNLGRLYQQTAPYYPGENVSQKYSYDALGRPVEVRNPDGTVRRFAYLHWNTTSIDENGNQRVEETDAYGQVTAVHEYSPADQTTRYRYDSAGQLVHITDALGNSFYFSYDSLGRKTSQQDPDLGNWAYSYDAAGNLASQTDARGKTTVFSYDELNRVTSKNTSDSAIAFNYDSPIKGTLSQIASPNWSANYSYDQRYRKVSESKAINGRLYPTQYSYDSMDRVTTVSLPAQQAIAYSHSSQNLVNGITGILSNVSHNAAGKDANRTYANGLTTIHSYDSLTLRLTRIQTGSLQDISYGYDNASNVLWINDSMRQRLVSNAYDALYRLVSSNWLDHGTPFQSFSYAYDVIGRILQLTAPDRMLDYTYAASPRHAPSQVTDAGPSMPRQGIPPTPMPEEEIQALREAMEADNQTGLNSTENQSEVPDAGIEINTG